MKKIKVLVVGGAGYVGGALVDHLIGHPLKKYDVTVYDKLIYEKRYLKEVDFVYGDVTDYDHLWSILEGGFDAVIWLAAVVGDGACAIDPCVTSRINTEAVRFLSDNYDGKIIFPSTCSVYGAQSGLLTEESSTNPLSVYAETKLRAEEYLLKNREDSLVFRLGTLYGVGDRHSRIRLDLIVNVMAKNATMGLPLTVFGGDQLRPILHVKDVGRAMEFGLSQKLSGLYNLHDVNMNIKDMAKSVTSLITGSEIIYSDISFEDARNYQVSSDKFRSRGWVPTLSVQDGIREIYNLVCHKRIVDTDDPVYYNAKYFKGCVCL